MGFEHPWILVSATGPGNCILLGYIDISRTKITPLRNLQLCCVLVSVSYCVAVDIYLHICMYESNSKVVIMQIAIGTKIFRVKENVQL